MTDSLTTKVVEQALRWLGDQLGSSPEVEVLLVGGAAGMVTGVLSADRVTIDCDVMVCLPEGAMSAVEHAAEQVAKELQLSPKWLNSDVQLRRDALPDGWENRKQWVGTYGPLRVFAASRIDLICMKILAGRDQDLEDLEAMAVREDDAAFVAQFLNTLASKGTTQEQIDDARLLLESLELHDHD